MAELIAAVVATLLAGISASTYFAVRRSALATEADSRAQDATNEVEKRCHQETERAEAAAYDARLKEVQALRLGRPPGWSKTCFESLGKNAQMQIPGRDEEPLRTAAITCMLDLDVEEVARLKGHGSPIWSLDFSPDGSLLAAPRQNGSHPDLGRSPAAVDQGNRRHGCRQVLAPVPFCFRGPPSASTPWETAWPTGRCGSRSSGSR